MRHFYLTLVIVLVPFAGCHGPTSGGLLSKSADRISAGENGLVSSETSDTGSRFKSQLATRNRISFGSSRDLSPGSAGLISNVTGARNESESSVRNRRQRPVQFASNGPLADPEMREPKANESPGLNRSRAAQVAESRSKKSATVQTVGYTQQSDPNGQVGNAGGSQSIVEPVFNPDFEFGGDSDSSDGTQNRTRSREPIRNDSGQFNSYKPVFSETGYGEPDVSMGRFPIDLPTVMQLAGADNWSVKIARERVCEAQANYELAKAAWLPSLVYGGGYNHHEGEIQGTVGDVISASRGSWFFGGGAVVGNNPIAGGSGGPLRLTADLSLADAIYRPLASRRLVEAARLGSSRVFNDTMLAASVTYFDLVEAQAALVIAYRNLQDAQRLGQTTAAFVEAGKGTIADSRRVEVIINQRQQEIANRTADIEIASARLAQVLQLDNTKLDPGMGLFAAENVVGPVYLVDQSLELSSLVHTAIATREDICEAEQLARAAQTEAEMERIRPFMPNVHLGYSGGVFGGGQGSDVNKLDGRSDIDVQVTWQLRNLGMGNRAAFKSRQSQLRQAIYQGKQLKDSIATEVTTAYHRVQQYDRAMQLTSSSVQAATEALDQNIEAIRGLEGMPLESVNSIEQLATSRNEYLRSVMDYNRSQLQLIRAIGQPLNANGCDGSCGGCCDGSCIGY